MLNTQNAILPELVSFTVRMKSRQSTIITRKAPITGPRSVNVELGLELLINNPRIQKPIKKISDKRAEHCQHRD